MEILAALVYDKDRNSKYAENNDEEEGVGAECGEDCVRGLLRGGVVNAASGNCKECACEWGGGVYVLRRCGGGERSIRGATTTLLFSLRTSTAHSGTVRARLRCRRSERNVITHVTFICWK